MLMDIGEPGLYYEDLYDLIRPLQPVRCHPLIVEYSQLN